MNHRQSEDQFSVGVYQKRDLVIVRGEGARVWDEAGREYVDCVAGIGVANVGHCHPAVVAAIRAQAGRLITCNELFYNDARAQCLERLDRITPEGINRFFLCNSGTEAVEGAIKFARMATGRKRVVAAMRGYHGKTLGSLSATWERKYKEPFAPLVPDFSHVPYNNIPEFEKTVDDQTAAVILEPVQGEGGVRPATAEFMQAVRAACDRKGALLIVDEIQTGFGRTGRMFACEHFGVLPDILTMAKGIAGGVPMGAIGIDRRVGEIEKLSHTSTFGGNPLACAAAVAAIDALVGENLPGRAAETGAYFVERLRAIGSPRIREIRGLGLMIGVELKDKAGPVAQALMQDGVLALLAGTTVLRFLPPLVIDREHVDRVVESLTRVLAAKPSAETE
jgi:LysW-gamma-L-lysine/LysW-L-ornithine aminotransferase